jgi:hypothetical protein
MHTHACGTKLLCKILDKAGCCSNAFDCDALPTLRGRSVSDVNSKGGPLDKDPKVAVTLALGDYHRISVLA